MVNKRNNITIRIINNVLVRIINNIAINKTNNTVVYDKILKIMENNWK